MSATGDRQAVVRTLSVRRAGRDPLADRLAAERLLGAVELHPPSLPPSAILCVRRLVDPRPGVLALGAGLRPPRAWEEALAAALDALVRRAASPARGAVPADTEAVVFADRAEVLSCLAADLLRGEIGDRWWWASLLPGARDLRAVARAFLDAPEHVPGALHLAAARGHAAPFLAALPLDDVLALARALGDRWGMPALPAAVACLAFLAAPPPPPPPRPGSPGPPRPAWNRPTPPPAPSWAWP